MTDTRQRNQADRPGKCACCMTKYVEGAELILERVNRHWYWMLEAHATKPLF